ncbi:MOSC domain-containing protein [Novosphingobium mangrovi (ex Hu et al. 2023)]|uniref:MOSC domain-containing protein n=1 Tax=Novosphingobium mangrovi (ex Hu et al. 2023) TaxID=2930094 RepID=A0ABT0AFK8_9SPHN|nr:MOSC domain-containing protein [Novosphingobium mangrovi (ex Hu et al. 2023)]MCJ1961987.1 MOSC domain-containing protein [Novosphingobium mangrovi (ex Hu et al. 2023)]
MRILSVNCGSVTRFRAADEHSAIAKRAVEGPVKVGWLGLEGDRQADLSVHGGPEKAIHHYPHDHYAYWGEVLGGHPLLEGEGAFGENISTQGLREEEVCIGDRFRMGSALVEVAQGRQPCWKLDHRFDGAKVMAGVVASRRSGWYYRVLEEGEVSAGGTLELVERPFPEWSVARVFGLLIAGDHKTDRAGLEALGEVTPLAEAWAKRRAKLLG